MITDPLILSNEKENTKGIINNFHLNDINGGNGYSLVTKWWGQCLHHIMAIISIEDAFTESGYLNWKHATHKNGLMTMKTQRVNLCQTIFLQG